MVEFSSEEKKRIAVENLASFYKGKEGPRLDFDESGQAILTLPFAGRNQENDLENIGLKHSYRRDEPGYLAEQVRHSSSIHTSGDSMSINSTSSEIKVQGDDQIQLLAEAGFSFPGADKFGYVESKVSRAKA